MSERIFTVSELNVAIKEYERQRGEFVENLRVLDEQRVHSIKTLDLLHGAILALETLRDSPVTITVDPRGGLPEKPQDIPNES